MDTPRIAELYRPEDLCAYCGCYSLGYFKDGPTYVGYAKPRSKLCPVCVANPYSTYRCYIKRKILEAIASNQKRSIMVKELKAYNPEFWAKEMLEFYVKPAIIVTLIDDLPEPTLKQRIRYKLQRVTSWLIGKIPPAWRKVDDL